MRQQEKGLQRFLLFGRTDGTLPRLGMDAPTTQGTFPPPKSTKPMFLLVRQAGNDLLIIGNAPQEESLQGRHPRMAYWGHSSSFPPPSHPSEPFTARSSERASCAPGTSPKSTKNRLFRFRSLFRSMCGDPWKGSPLLTLHFPLWSVSLGALHRAWESAHKQN